MLGFKTWFEFEKDDLKDGFYLYPKRRILLFVLGIFVLLLAIFKLWTAASLETVTGLDRLIENLVSRYRTPLGEDLFFLITLFGSQYFIISAVLILMIPLFFKRRKRAAVTVFLTLVGSLVLIQVLKGFFGRIRPSGCYRGVDCLSYPSGHAALSFYFYGIIYYLGIKFLKLDRTFFFLTGVGFLLVICLIAVSRIYLGLHYFSDVVAGFLLGGICWLVAAILIDFFYQKYS
jgi:undecaprenyl-diphosphatase